MSGTTKQIQTLDMIMTDIEEDVRDLEGRPFTGKNVARQFGNMGAQIQAIARILKEHLDPSQPEDGQDEVKVLFDMVYQWGRVGLVVDHTAPAFQEQLQKVRALS